MIEQIKQWDKENRESYYGLDADTVSKILWEFEETLEKVEELQKALEQIAKADDNSLIEHPHQMADIAREALERSKSQ